MAILPIVRLGHPALRTPAEPVPLARLGSGEIQQLIDDLVETMRDAHGVGLAAPQLGIGLQLFVYECAPQSGGDKPAERSEVIPLQIVVNPMITLEPGEPVFDWEGCLSIPDLRGLVPRSAAVRVRGLDRHGAPLDYTAAGLAARIIQHEFDHLNGVIFLDRMRDLKTLGFGEEWERFLASGVATAEPALP
jgi:peptide deformylase